MQFQDLDAQFINLFLSSVENTFTKVLSSEMTRGQFTIWRNHMADNDLAGLTGITGHHHTGIAVYSMKSATAERLICHLDPGFRADEDNTIFYDGFGEVINIISGNVMTDFSKEKIDIDITTPSIIAGKAFNLHIPNQTTLSADMLSEFGTIEVNLAIKRQNSQKAQIAA